MNTLFLVIQAAIFGVVASVAFPGFPIEFWLAIVANSTTTVLYGVACRSEK